MARIAVLIDNKFEDSEYKKPTTAYKKAKHELVILGVKKGTVTGESGGLKVKVEKVVSDVSADYFDVLFIPGGYSPDQLRSHDEVVTFVKQFAATGRPIFFICHGAQLLITADVLKGRKVTGWKSIIQDIKNAGAEYLDAEVVEDGNLISSRCPADIPAFIKATLAKLSKAAAPRGQDAPKEPSDFVNPANQEKNNDYKDDIMDADSTAVSSGFPNDIPK